MIAAGGPVRVYATEPSIKVYWGDLHSHSRISKDAIGGDDFDYARNITCLDFFPSTEHCNDDARQDSITPGEWRFIQDQVQRFNEPGRFVTLLAYEASLGTGHHNIIYRSLEGSPWPAHRLKEIADVWERLKVGDAITIPHHMGIHWGSSKWGPVVDWTKPQDDRLRPLLEIYSLHGASEYYNPEDPLAYDNVDFTPASSADGPHYARDAWGQGHVMGVVGGSDNHTAQPGLPHGGLTAVFAPELTRHAIFDALAQRHSYGTTGERILLEFDVASAAMGQQATASGNVQGNLLVAAPRDIRFAEVLSLEGASTQWHSVARWESPGKLLRASFDTTVGKTGATLYLRIELTGETGGRVTRAWSSPIWLRP